MDTEKFPQQFNADSQNIKKNEKLPTKKEWLEIVRQYISINPEIEPEEAIRRIQAVSEVNNPNKSAEERAKARNVDALREERLQRLGLDPTQWTYYNQAQPKELRFGNTDVPFTEEDMALVSSKFPEGIQLFVIQGKITSGSELVEEPNPYRIVDHWWEIYVGLRPAEQINPPQPPSIPEGESGLN